MPLDFSNAESQPSQQDLEVTPEQVQNGDAIPLRFVRFQNVHQLTVGCAVRAATTASSPP